jgi:hypothetical protein
MATERQTSPLPANPEKRSFPLDLSIKDITPTLAELNNLETRTNQRQSFGVALRDLLTNIEYDVVPIESALPEQNSIFKTADEAESWATNSKEDEAIIRARIQEQEAKMKAEAAQILAGLLLGHMDPKANPADFPVKKTNGSEPFLDPGFDDSRPELSMKVLELRGFLLGIFQNNALTAKDSPKSAAPQAAANFPKVFLSSVEELLNGFGNLTSLLTKL